MITLFRVDTFFHIFSVLVVLLLLKLPFISGGLPVLQPEMEWLIVGQRLNDGHSLYADIWTKTGPLAAYIYGFVNWFLGDDQVYYEMFALVLAYFQSLYFAYIINKNKVLIEKNYLPALFYAILISISFDLSKLSPALLANTFVLLALNSLFKHIDKAGETSEHVFEVGLQIGIGSLISYTFPSFFIWSVLSLLMFAPFKANQVFLMILGFVLPLAISVLFFYFNGTLEGFYQQWILQIYDLIPKVGSEILDVLIIFGLPLVLSVFGILKVLSNVRFSNYQNRKHQIMILLGLFALLPYFLAKPHGTFHLVGLVPYLAFFLSSWFVFIKGAYRSEIIFLLFLGAVVLIKFQGVSPIIGNGYEHLASIRLYSENEKAYVKNRKIMVTGEAMDDFLNAQSGSAFVNWELSSNILEHPEVYQNLAVIFNKFEKEKPEYIIDNAQVFPDIFLKIPSLNAAYERVEGTRHFRLKGI
ncbi:hypothetical protein [Jiulongibacter sp. NS-SX5]|uniref:hypothetical protein n=1 Tax=Jiulongibacter sp. NS-SX5 TaxID=3463854 RepID=UPI004059E299